MELSLLWSGWSGPECRSRYNLRPMYYGMSCSQSAFVTGGMLDERLPGNPLENSGHRQLPTPAIEFLRGGPIWTKTLRTAAL